MQYPLNLSFKIIALAPQLAVTDANGNLLFYVKQKLFKLKEAVTVFADEAQTRPLFYINADRVFDISAQYTFTDTNGNYVGAVKRHGLASLWQARYDVLAGDFVSMTISEENPWIKVIDGLVGEIPVVGMFTGYLFHPAYRASRPDGTGVMRMEKQPAFLEGKFTIEHLAPLDAAEEIRVVLAYIMMILLERSRG